jgi:hypothetical protein
MLCVTFLKYPLFKITLVLMRELGQNSIYPLRSARHVNNSNNCHRNNLADICCYRLNYRRPESGLSTGEDNCQPRGDWQLFYWRSLRNLLFRPKDIMNNGRNNVFHHCPVCLFPFAEFIGLSLSSPASQPLALDY